MKHKYLYLYFILDVFIQFIYHKIKVTERFKTEWHAN